MKKTPTQTTLAMCGLLLATASSHAANVAISIMYATTPSVRSTWGGSSNTNSKIAAQFNRLKTNHSNSTTEVAWTKTSNHEAIYDESDVTASTQLDRLESGSQLVATRDKRDALKADLVQLVCEWTDTTIAGKARIAGWCSIVRKDVFASTSGAGSMTASHEVGHNLNAVHDHGFCISSIKQRTIMEPNDSEECSSFSRINYFSSSSVAPRGVVLGDSTHKNRERVRAQRSTAAAYK
jgi:hypothetical protein